jgi:hypothetical protein
LLDICFEGYIVGEDDYWEEEGVADLQDAGLEMLDAIYNVGGGCAFAETSCYAAVYVV